ncbi:S-adenosyl-L-methionine-dependent methyltransferase [Melanomma pulvis-pyrius CBS 109.77]|uniref:RNA methyltransferase n=1 Tax=Melanomma pulvis-pyrius CBS 109.77 TaxID=1314802 RepID=A0A6A6XBU8_9PLEO|nr:S-adenosyl-L-methionine-dependent methyltransferase [Melanomma pulvis-pyrius CBS 109.77]
MATNWGNYTDYQNPASQFPGSAPSSHVRDARLILLERLIPALFQAKTCLDIGCNAGNVSCQLAFDFDAVSVTGVDIDPALVTAAESLLAFRSSRARPPTHASERTVDYFPMSAVLTHGCRFDPPRPPVSAPPAHSKWPHVTFIAADWVLSANPATSGPYDVILALSVIKWIHLEHLDQGLVTFFRKCSSSLAPGGYLVVELQTWDSYQRAVRPNKAPHFGESVKKLTHRPETFSQLLQEHGLHLCATSTALPRRISVYRKD